jgi:two-component system chemotaxis sensor kinase CheA
MSGMDELRVSFFQECEDLLESLGEGLRTMADPDVDQDMETVHAVFRAVHSIKGGAGAFGLDDLVTFAHLFETVLDHMRCGKMDATDAAMRTLLRAGDMLSDLVICARDEIEPDTVRLAELLAELDAMADGAGEEDDAGTFEFVPTVMSVEPIQLPDAIEESAAPPEPEDAGLRIFLIEFAPGPDLYTTGNEPLALFQALRRLGRLEVRPETSRIRPIAHLDLREPGLAWNLRLETESPEEEILTVFEFVADLAFLKIHASPGDRPPASFDPDPDPRRTESEAAGEDGVAEAESGVDELPAVPSQPSNTPNAPVSAEKDIGPARPRPASQRDAPQSAAPPATIRVNLDRVDRLINLIGELVIMEAMLSQAVETAGLDGNSDVSNGLDGIKQLASGIQESVMSIRAQPLKPVFQRMHRIIREAADATGKQVRLATSGEHTEVDKTVIERLVDPLTHMIRNSVDHGLEDGAARRAAGKPEIGTISLSAAHRSGRVIIEVCDDGAGINREKVRAIAERKGLVPPGASLTNGEIDNLLFTPGFSSKEEVSALSGRGVGLDVVRREIMSLGGRVTIQSTAGEGTTFTIALPLTLAVLEGMLVEFSGEMMVLPLSAILETLRPSSATIHSIGRSGRVVANRGELIPIIDLGTVFGIGSGESPEERDVLLLVECEAGRRAALAVDLIHDQRQVVIKSLEENYGAVPGISAATILGDGRIALIVDPEEIIASAAPELPSPPLAANE